MTIGITDHIFKARERLQIQYKESPNLLSYIEGLLGPAVDIENALNELMVNRWIDTAEGINLDNLGEIVGQPRALHDTTSYAFFGFDTAVNAGTFGDLNDPQVGERFRSALEPESGTTVFADPEYRILLKAKVLFNISNCSVPDLEHIAYQLLQVDTNVIQDSSMTIRFRFYASLDNITKNLVGILFPRPTSVNYIFQDNIGIFVPGT